MPEHIDINQYLNGENLYVEYKDDNHANFDFDTVVCACVGMANSAGGTILIGVKSENNHSGKGIITGSKIASKMSASAVEGKILENTLPNLPTQVSFFPINKDANIIIIKVNKTNFIVSTTNGRYLKRQLNSHGEPKNTPMTQEEILRETSRIGMNDLSSIVINNSSLDDIDLDLVQRVANDVLKDAIDAYDKEIFSHSPIDILKSLHLVNHDNKPTIAAILMFGTDEALREKIPNHFVRYQVFNNSGDILKNTVLSEPIATLLPKLLQMPEININTNEFVIDGKSFIIPEYSNSGIREAFANALVHRDYTMHSGVIIQVFSGELRIISAGGFLRGITIDNLLNVVPTPRNKRLADGMRAFKFVESSGRGIDKIYYSQARYGRPAPDYSASNDTNVTVSLVGGKANVDFVKSIIKLKGTPTIKEMLVLNSLFYQRSMDIFQIAHLIQSNELDARRLVTELLKKEWIEIMDEKNPLYFLKGTLKNQKVRLTDKNIKEYQKSVIEILETHPKVSRFELAKTIGLTPMQVYSVLKKSEEENLISMKGRTWVVKPNPKQTNLF